MRPVVGLTCNDICGGLEFVDGFEFSGVGIGGDLAQAGAAFVQEKDHGERDVLIGVGGIGVPSLRGCALGARFKVDFPAAGVVAEAPFHLGEPHGFVGLSGGTGEDGVVAADGGGGVGEM